MIIDPLVTLTHELVGDDLTVTAGVTDGPIGTAAVRIRLSVGGTAPDKSITISARAREGQTRTQTFTDLTPGAYELSAIVVGRAWLAEIATPTFAVLPTLELVPEDQIVDIVVTEAATVMVRTTGAPAVNVNVTVTATHSDGSGVTAFKTAELTPADFTQDVTFSSGVGNDLTTAGTYNLSVSVDDTTEAGHVIVPGDTLATIVVNDLTKPTVTITPTVNRGRSHCGGGGYRSDIGSSEDHRTGTDRGFHPCPQRRRHSSD